MKSDSRGNSFLLESALVGLPRGDGGSGAVFGCGHEREHGGGGVVEADEECSADQHHNGGGDGP